MPPWNGHRRGNTRRRRRRPPPRQESERMHESAGADGDEELSVPQAFQENDDDDPAKGAQGGERECVVYWYSI